MALVKRQLGAWGSNQIPGASPSYVALPVSGGPWWQTATVVAAAPGAPPPAGWTGGCGGPGLPACTPEYTSRPLPMIPGGPGQPTTAKWSLSPGQKPPPPGQGWQGDPVPLAPIQPPTAYQGSPAIAVTYPESGASSPAPSPPPPLRIFGLPPLVVIGAGGLLVFLIARRL